MNHFPGGLEVLRDETSEMPCGRPCEDAPEPKPRMTFDPMLQFAYAAES